MKRTVLARAFWGALGVTALSLGVIGIFLPGLPTTPFILLAAACFSRSSERLTSWLRRHPTFGQLIRNWEDGRRISRKAKRSALLVIAVGALVAAITLEGRPVLLGVILLTVSCVVVYIWRRPE